ncbi:MAG TPA: hypothetical protein VF763_08480 [Candidatus Limnocylindrales bacterium]
MAIHRRPLGRGRWIAALAAIVLLVACALPWFRVGGGEGIPPISGNGFEGASVLVFVAALAVLALVALPYASDAPLGIDRALSYWLLLAVAAVGLLLRAVDLLQRDALFLPDRAPGLWLAALGVVILARGAYEVQEAGEPR